MLSYLLLSTAAVAQLDRASDYGSEGSGFKSLRLHSQLFCSASIAKRSESNPEQVKFSMAHFFWCDSGINYKRELLAGVVFTQLSKRYAR